MQKYHSKSSKISQSIVSASFAFLVFLIFIPYSLVALALDETSEQILDLRKQIEELTKQAEQYKGTIAEKQKQADTLERQISILTNQIKKLETNIAITDRQITAAGIEIVELEEQIFEKKEDIDQKKEAMGEIVQYLYERDRLSLFAALLKSPTLSAFTNEAKQAEDVNRRLVGFLVDLKNQKETLEQTKIELEQKKTDIEALNEKQSVQKVSLGGSKTGKDQLLNKTKGEEVRYQQLLNDAERRKAEFFAELQRLESEAVERGAFIVHVTATSVPPKGSKIFRWPYDDYILTQGYGYTTYARRGAYGGAPHNGIDFAAGLATPIKPVMVGAILASGYNNGFGNWVAVLHPNNLVSVYAHMQSPSGLANGTQVNLGSIIGYEGSTGNSTGSHLHLSLYRDFFTYINAKNNQLYFNYFDGSLNPLDYL